MPCGDADELTSPMEEILNIVRMIGKRVCRIVFAIDDSTMPTPVGVDQAAQEIAREGRGAIALPGFQNDGARMLAATPVLWGKGRPGGQITIALRAVGIAAAAASS